MSNINVEEDIISAMSKEIQEQIDGELMADMLVSMGWHKIPKQFYYSNLHAVNIKLWLEEHCKGNYRRLGNNWVFENKGDAVNYALRWL